MDKQKRILIISIVVTFIAISIIIFLSVGDEKAEVPYASLPSGDSRDIAERRASENEFTIFKNRTSQTTLQEKISLSFSPLSFLQPKEATKYEDPEKKTVPPVNTYPQTPQSKPTTTTETNIEPTTPTPPITEQELFDELYPTRYRTVLTSWQRELTNVGAIPASEQSSFGTEDEIVEFLKTFVTFLAEKNYIPQEDATRFLTTGLDEWQRKQAELEKQIILGEISLNIGEKLFGTNYTNPLSLKNLLGYATDIFQVKKATAQSEHYFCPAGENCNFSNEFCSQTGGGTVGRLLWAPCCFCAIPVESPGCEWCEEFPESLECLSCSTSFLPVGCLNAVGLTRNSLWHYPSGTCGTT